jgi:predicted DsbA family dithiol-disulfide isomerase
LIEIIIKEQLINKKMKINIWSDVRCPFCYIGKKKFEIALEKFQHKNNVNVEWQSFELDPNLVTEEDVNALDHLAEIKGISKSKAKEMNQYVAQVAREVGLDFNFEKVVVANSFNAHRVIQFAKSKGLGNEAEEALFKAHFIEGKNIDRNETLVQTAVSIGLDENETREMIASGAFSKEVKQDEMQAQDFGISGVPFFVLNDKYAVSGAQSPETFLQALEQTWKESEEGKKPVIISEGESCSIDGNCN